MNKFSDWVFTLVFISVISAIVHALIARFKRNRGLETIPASVMAAEDGARWAMGDIYELDRLWRLRSNGALSEEDFAAQRAALFVKYLPAGAAAGDQKAVLLVAGIANKKIETIKQIRRACPQHGLAAGKYIVDNAPQILASRLSTQQAESVQLQLQAAGLTVRVI
jgi:ribosomal protein L7/L12